MDVLEPLKLVSQGGAAVAVIIVVWLFLKQQDKMSELIKGISKEFTDILKNIQDKNDERHMALQGQVNDLVKDQIKSNTEMTAAIHELRTSITEFKRG